MSALDSLTRSPTVPSTTDGPATAFEPTTRFTNALAAVQAELAALPADSLEPINLDIPAAVVTAVGCMTELRLHRAALEARFGKETVEALDRLEVYARAASQANVKYTLAGGGSGIDVQELSRRVVEMRTMLLADATALVHRKVLAPELLSELRGPVGFRNQINDVQQLVQVFRDAWDRVQAVSPVKKTELDQAEDVANDLLVALGAREQAPESTTAAADTRQRAFTLFVRTYDELRRAMTYLRWREGDVDSIIPSLYAGRGGRGKRVESEPTPVAGPSPSPSSDLGGEEKPAVIETKPAVPVVSPEVAPTEQKPRVGMPGADPFVS